MKLRLVLILCSISLLSVVGRAADKKRVAVMNFDFGTVQQWWSGNWDIGKGISDLIVNELVTAGAYRVIERNRLDQVLGEQDLGESGRANPASAAKVGKVLGVNAMIVGSITQFGTENKKKGVGGGAFGRIGFGGGTFGTSKGKAIVAIDARVVDTTTGEILAVAKGSGESSRSGMMLGGYGGGSGGGGFGGIDMSSSDFRETILGEAVQLAVQQLSQELIGAEDRIPEVTIEVDGLVADVDGSSVIVNVGSSHGLEAGTVLQVHRVTRSVKDPATGRVLREITSVIGKLRLDVVDEGSSVGSLISGDSVRVGDKVTN